MQHIDLSPSRLILHSWTLDNTPLPEILRVAKEAGYYGVELRHADFQRCIEAGQPRQDIVSMICSSGLAVPVLGVPGGLLFAAGDEQRRLFDALSQTAADAAALGCPVLMISPGQNAPDKPLDEVAECFAEAAGIAARYGARLALEFNSRHPVINSPLVATRIAELAAHPNAGLLLDAYHLECSGHGGRGFESVPAELIWAFQFSDAPTADRSASRRPLDRLPPGRGCVRWREVFELLEQKGYDGPLSYEAPNPAQWDRPPLEVALEGFDVFDLVRQPAGG